MPRYLDEFNREGREAMETTTFVPSPEVARDLELLVQRGRYRDLSEARMKPSGC